MEDRKKERKKEKKKEIIQLDEKGSQNKINQIRKIENKTSLRPVSRTAQELVIKWGM